MNKSARPANNADPSESAVPVRSSTIPTHRVIEAPFLKGEKIAGRYVVERVIAEGGMGIVLAARHLELDETVAIKFLKPEFARQPDLIGRFAREAKAAARIKSEHIATVHDVGVVPDRGPFIVMEYLDGDDLESVLATEGRLPVERSVELTLQVCEALASAHAQGIIHRDVKPENLFLIQGDQGLPTVKVLDFGVSKTALTGASFDGAISVVKTQSLLGSPLYMSPEQLRGKTEVDFRTDIWSLGAVLYELLTGRVPFEGTSITEVCASVLETTPEPIASLAPEVPSGLVDVVARCLEKDPGARYQTVAELAVALAPFGPKRARLCVERAIAVSLAAGLVSASLQAPMSLPPPPVRPSVGPASVSVGAAADAQTQEDAPDEPARPTSSGSGATRRAAAAAALFALGAGGMLAAKSFLSPPPPPPPAVAAPVTPAVVTPAPSAAPAAPAPTHNAAAAPVEPAAAAVPAARPAGRAKPAGQGGATGQATARGATNTAPLAVQPAAGAAPAPQTTATTTPVRSAIDDRK